VESEDDSEEPDAEISRGDLAPIPEETAVGDTASTNAAAASAGATMIDGSPGLPASTADASGAAASTPGWAPATETPAEGEGDDREDGPWLPVAQRTQRVAFCPCPTNSVRTH